MGKLINNAITGQRRAKCADETAPICPSVCCSSSDSDGSIGATTTRKSRPKGIYSFDRPPPDEIDNDNDNDSGNDSGNEIKELLVVGAGPHSLSLLLRLLEPDPDLLSDKTRHYQADYESKMRPLSHVRNHLQKLSKGPSVTLKRKKEKKTKTSKQSNSSRKRTAAKFCNGNAVLPPVPPSLSLETVRNSVLVVDSSGDRWLSQWKQNFGAIGIPKLRSLMNAHADPYDHRSLEFYAELKGRGGTELIQLPKLSQRDKDFHGPYQVPSTRLFNDFHDLLAKGYGIEDVVRKGTVHSIDVVRGDDPDRDGDRDDDTDGDEDEPVFRVTIGWDGIDTSTTTTKTIKARRVVCAMGPMFNTGEAFWEASLRKELAEKIVSYPSDRILHPTEIVPFLVNKQKEQELLQRQQKELLLQQQEQELLQQRKQELLLQEQEQEQELILLQQEQEQEQQLPQPQSPATSTNTSTSATESALRRLLIVGGGITSAQLAMLAAKSSWCRSVKLIQRSRALPRHFDVENKWMGPRRGQLLDEFWALDMPQRAQLLKEARLGGSIPPEILQQLDRCQQNKQTQHANDNDNENINNLEVQEEVQISQVQWNETEELFRVEFDDGSDFEECDMIWLVTGSENHLDNYSAFSRLREVLPVDVVGGLPVLTKDLSWGCPCPSSSTTANDEPEWKRVARKRMWCIGSLAGLELGPDALNLVGARQGAVRVATSLRRDML
uniref:L-ornithine N(5)-monooxygenase n=1 Tax=Pseudo-nitzschia australis TaxID=44445 RepID=A0A7S4AP57_9STRA